MFRRAKGTVGPPSRAAPTIRSSRCPAFARVAQSHARGEKLGWIVSSARDRCSPSLQTVSGGLSRRGFGGTRRGAYETFRALHCVGGLRGRGSGNHGGGGGSTTHRIAASRDSSTPRERVGSLCCSDRHRRRATAPDDPAPYPPLGVRGGHSALAASRRTRCTGAGSPACLARDSAHSAHSTARDDSLRQYIRGGEGGIATTARAVPAARGAARRAACTPAARFPSAAFARAHGPGFAPRAGHAGTRITATRDHHPGDPARTTRSTACCAGGTSHAYPAERPERVEPGSTTHDGHAGGFVTDLDDSTRAARTATPEDSSSSVDDLLHARHRARNGRDSARSAIIAGAIADAQPA